jgi:type I restriction enzyme S subunit
MTALVTKHLPLVAGAPDGIKKLRGLILELAVRGQLVSHDQSELPIGDLLRQISAARDVSSAKGQSRKGAATEQGLEPRFDAPTGWQWVRLGELLTKIGAGSTPLGGKQAYVASGVKFLRSQNVWNDGLRLDDVALISDETHQKMSGTHVAAGDILFNITGASIGRCALVPESFSTGNVSQHVTIIRPCIPDLRSYLHKVLISGLVQDTVMAVQVGVSREGLSIGKLAQFPIPLPPLAEQHRIVAKVDELMALCDRLEADQADAEAAHAQLVQALLGSLTQATDAADFRASWQRLSEHFHTLFTTEASIDALKQAVLQLAVKGVLTQRLKTDVPAYKLLEELAADAANYCIAHKAPQPVAASVSARDEPFPIPETWKWARLQSLFRVITDGDHQAPPRAESGVAFLTIGNVASGGLEFDGCREVESDYFANLAAYRKPAIGDLLYTVVGATYGRPVLVDIERPFCVQRHIAILKRSDLLVAKFGLYLLFSPLVYDQATSCVTGTAQPTVPLKPLRNILVPLPPLAEQHRIVATVDELMALCDQLKAQLAEARQQHTQLATVIVEQTVA